MSGRHFATCQTSPEVRVAASTVEASKWVSDSSIAAMFVAGVGVSLPVSISTNVLSGSASMLASYAIPIILNWIPALVGTTGASSLTVFGTSFGRLPFSQRNRLRQTSSAATVWRSDSTIFCLVPSGYSRNIIILATAGSNAGSVTTLAFYSANFLSGATNMNLPTTGSVSVTIYGQGLGNALPTVDARIGGTACKGSFWSSESSMFCKANNGISIFRDTVVSI